MKKFFLSALLLSLAATGTMAQPKEGKANGTNELNPDYTVTTENTVTIRGTKIPYKAIAGTIPVWNDSGKVIAGVFFTYYERTDSKDRAARPLVISFNGGPGTPSVWMELGYTGPRLLNIDEEGYPVQPYGIKENNNSILDVADIVYVDPVNTGYSRIIGNAAKSTFFGVNADIKYLAAWISTFVTRYNRWPSPKYLIGESYGTNRVSGLALELQKSQWMFLNGVVLVSPTTLGIERPGPIDIASHLPYYAATAWYHKALAPELQKKELTALLPEVEEFTIQELIPALTRGGFLDEAKKKTIAAKMARYSGISEKVILQRNLSIPTRFFWKELLRDRGYTIGRLDSRYLGIDSQDGSDTTEYNAELIAWNHAFSPAMNHYLREDLKYTTDLKYYMFGPTNPWDRSNDHTGDNLRLAMAQNPYLYVFVQSGYFDGACDYFNAQYNMWQMDPSGKLKERLSWKGYPSGHMMYLRKPDLETSTRDLRDFIGKTLPGPGQPARYKAPF